MQPLEIPVASPTAKLVMGTVCVLINFAELRYALPGFVRFVRVKAGWESQKPGTKSIPLGWGLFIYLVLFFPGVLTSLIFIGITTTPPSVVSDAGVAGGGGPLTSRKTIAWDEVQRVDCLMGHDQSVRIIRVVSGAKRVELSGGGDLTGVHDLISQRVPAQAVRRCSIPMRSTR